MARPFRSCPFVEGIGSNNESDIDARVVQNSALVCGDKIADTFDDTGKCGEPLGGDSSDDTAFCI